MTQHRGRVSFTPPPNIVIPPDDFLRDVVEKKFRILYSCVIGKQLEYLGVTVPGDPSNPPDYNLVRRILDSARNLTIGSPMALMWYNQYRALWDAHQALICGGYAAFLAQADTINRSKKTNALCGSSIFQDLVKLVRPRQGVHPKFLKLLEILRQSKTLKQVCVVFVQDAATGNFITQELRKRDFVCESATTTTARQADFLACSEQFLKLQCRQVDVLVASTHFQSKLMIDQVDQFFQFSIPYPWVEGNAKLLEERQNMSWNQRITQLLLNHPFDRNLYFRAYHCSAFPEIYAEEQKPRKPKWTQPSERPPAKKKQKAAGGSEGQLPLFGEEQP